MIKRSRRGEERWVDCEAAAAAYERLTAAQRSDFNPAALARIRGREGRGVTLPTRLMTLSSIKAFQKAACVPLESLLANGDGLSPLKPSQAELQISAANTPELTGMFSKFEDTVYSILRVAGLLTEHCKRGTQNDPDGLKLQDELSKLGKKFYAEISLLSELYSQSDEHHKKISSLYSEIIKIFNNKDSVSVGSIVQRMQEVKSALRAM